MNITLMLIMSGVVALNLIIILWKYKKKRFADAMIDSMLLIAVAVLFNMSTMALFAGAIGSLIVSIYLFISPPKIKGIT